MARPQIAKLDLKTSEDRTELVAHNIYAERWKTRNTVQFFTQQTYIYFSIHFGHSLVLSLACQICGIDSLLPKQFMVGSG
jgi:hypothetical protein